MSTLWQDYFKCAGGSLRHRGMHMLWQPHTIAHNVWWNHKTVNGCFMCWFSLTFTISFTWKLCVNTNEQSNDKERNNTIMTIHFHDTTPNLLPMTIYTDAFIAYLQPTITDLIKCVFGVTSLPYICILYNGFPIWPAIIMCT